MGFGPLPIDAYWVRPQIEILSVCRAHQNPPPERALYGQTSTPIGSISVAGVEYSLTEQVQGEFFANRLGSGEFSVSEFDWILGRGKTLTDAKQDWLEQFHAEFQRLFVMRPFEFEDGDKEKWEQMSRLVDVDKYRESQPITALQRGKLIQSRPQPSLVEWNDGTRERISIGSVPPEFAGYRVGQIFEAVVHRNPRTQKMMRIEYLKRIPSHELPTQMDIDRVWDSLPTSERLPTTTWD